MAGWDELGLETGRVLQQMPEPQNTFIFGLRYQIASELAFYMPGQPRTVSINRWKRPNVYDYWWQDSDLAGMDAVGVVYGGSDNQMKHLLQVFDRVDPPLKFTIYKRRGFMRNRTSVEAVKFFYIYKAYGFKGGLRWIPPNRRDIRAR
jgi:undecaprenyl-diphosphatase